MKTMILDTSSTNLYVSFVEENDNQLREIYKKVLKTVNNHSEHFLDAIKEGLDSLNLQVKDFGKIIVGEGPGSYTGLRVAITVSKMFSWTMNIDLYTINSLLVLGSNYLNKDGMYAFINLAKKNYFYYIIVEVKNSKPTIIKPSSFSSIEVFEEELLNYQNIQKIYIDEWDYNSLNIINSEFIKKVEDVHALVPNYLRKEI